MLDPKLTSLLEVYASGSFSTAAQKLALTQPAVSQHIKLLEMELGVKIFERSKGKLFVTKQGEVIIRAAQKMDGIYRLMKQELDDSVSRREHLTVGITHTAESNPIAEALARFTSENDGVNITMITDTISNLYKKLLTYELDIIITEGRSNDSNLRYLLLDTDCLVLAVSPEHRMAKKSMVTLDELKRERLILRMPGSGTRNLFVSHLESNNMDIGEFNVIMELDNVATIKDLIRRNFGVSILPKGVCLDELKKGKLIVLPVENLSMIREINIGYLSDFTQTELLQGIVKAYNETLRKYK